MKTHRILLFTILVAPICLAADSAPKLLSSKLHVLAGLPSLDCGYISLGTAREAAVTCARNAVSSGTAFRIAIQYQGVDSLVWQGAAGDGHGELWVLSYDSDPSGGSQTGAVINVTPCSKIEFVPVHGRDDIACQAKGSEP